MKKRKMAGERLGYTLCMSRARIGMFGGTFDPPHLGHLILAGEAVQQLGLGRLLWVLTPTPPHKRDQPITAIENRLAMLKLAIANNPAFEVSRLELDREGPHYTIDTLRLLAAEERGADIVLLLGGDSLRDLPKWRQSQELPGACSLIGVMRRPGHAVQLSALERELPGIRSKVRFMDAPPIEIASSEVRERVARQIHFRYYVPPAVYDYIEQNNLYR